MIVPLSTFFFLIGNWISDMIEFQRFFISGTRIICILFTTSLLYFYNPIVNAQTRQTKQQSRVSTPFVVRNFDPTEQRSGYNSADPKYYAYHPRTGLALGRGFIPSDVTDVKLPCISSTAVHLDGGAVSTELKMSYVNKYSHAFQSLGLDTKVEASYLGTKANVGLTLKTESQFSKSNIVVILTAKSDFGRWGIGADYRLTDSAQKLLVDSEKFSDTCGSRYVAIERRGSSVSAIITLQFVSAEDKSSFDAEFSVSGGWGAVSAKASAKLSTLLKRAASRDQINVEIFTTGGPGLGNLGEAIKELARSKSDPLTAIQNALGAALSGFTPANAVPLEYTVASMEQFGWDPSGYGLYTDYHEESLRRIADEYRDTYKDIQIVKEMKEGTHILNKLLSLFVVDALVKHLKYAEDDLESLRQSHSKCKNELTVSYCEYRRTVDLLTENILEVLHPPRIDFIVPWLKSNPEIRLVLNAPKGKRYLTAAQFDPRLANGFGIGLQAVGTNVFSVQLWTSFTMIKGDGTTEKYEQYWSEWPYKNGDQYTWAIESPNGAGAIPGQVPLEDEFHEWFKTGRGKFEGQTYLRVKDASGERSFDLKLMDAVFEVNNSGEFVAYEHSFTY